MTATFATLGVIFLIIIMSFLLAFLEIVIEEWSASVKEKRERKRKEMSNDE